MTYSKPMLINILSKIKKEGRLKLLEDVIAPLLNLLNNENFLVKLNNSKDVILIDDQQIIINNNYYYVDQNDSLTIARTIHDCKLFPIIDKVSTSDALMDLLDQIESVVNKTTNRKNNKFLAFFFSYDNSKIFLYNYICNIIQMGHKYNYSFKITQFAIRLAESMLMFIITQIPLLKELLNCLERDKISNVSHQNVIFIIKLVDMLFTNNLEAKNIIFQNLGVVDATIQDYICLYLLDKLYIHGYQGTIYHDYIQKAVASYISNIDKIAQANLKSKTYVNLGYSLIDLFINLEGFIIEDKWLEETKNNIKVIRPSSKLLERVLSKHQKVKIFIAEQFLHERFNKSATYDRDYYKLIHINPRIDMKIKEDNYLHKGPLFTKLSVDVDYLIKFLEKLENLIGFSEQEWWALYDINLNKIDNLRNLGGFLAPIIDLLRDEASNFDGYKSANTMKGIITKVVTEAKKNANEDPMFILFYETYENYKDVIFDMIDKIFQRKLLLINCIKDCIRYSIFKYFMLGSFIDSRGRRYLEGLSLNINSNPYAKIFIRLYNENINEDVSSQELQIIKNCFQFEQTKAKVPSLSMENTYKNQAILLDYIKSYLRINIKELVSWIQEPQYYTQSQLLLDKILSQIKKPKYLFYVHSLIYYEQLHFRKVHAKHIINYVRKDVSSSGTQMMSILFRNKQLGIISNLIGKGNFDFYEKAREHNYKIYMEIYNYVVDQSQQFNYEYLLTIKMDLQTIIYNQKDYIEILKIKDDEAETLFAMFLKLDLYKSSIARQLMQDLIKIIQQKNVTMDKAIIPIILQYLPSSMVMIINQLCSLEDFKDNKQEIEYLFSLRWAIRLINAVEQHIGISHNPTDIDSLWFSRDLTKNPVMTLMYMSTAYGRKEGYYELIGEKYVLGKHNKLLLKELTNFLEITTSNFIMKETPLNIIHEFLKDVCQGNKIVIDNKDFVITLDPKKTKDIQISCSSYSGKRGPQLVIKQYLHEINNEKLQSMLMANLAHIMDSKIMHVFTQLCVQINESLKKKGYTFKLVYETIHDCFLLNNPSLLPILIEEAYLIVCKENNLENIQGLSKQILDKYIKMTSEEFLKLLNPINNNFIK